jgi:exonuclease VII small subunit
LSQAVEQILPLLQQLPLAPIETARLLGHGFQAAAHCLDNGGSESDAIAALCLPLLTQSNGAQRLAPQFQSLGEPLLQQLTPIWTVLDTTLTPFCQAPQNTRANEMLLRQLDRLPPTTRSVLAATLLGALHTGELVPLDSAWALTPDALRWTRTLAQRLNQLDPTPLTRSLLHTSQTLSASKRGAPPFPAATTPLPEGAQLIEALRLASQLHQSQKRLDTGAPYLAHLLHVGGTVLTLGLGQEAAMAALLHDAPEDQGGEPVLRNIADRFGPAVAQMVQEASLPDFSDWMGGRQQFLQQLLSGVQPATYGVILADKRHNLYTLTRSLREQGPALWRHFYGTREQQLWFYRSVQAALKTRLGNTQAVQRLRAAVSQLEETAYPNQDPIQKLLRGRERRQEAQQALAIAQQTLASNPTLQRLNQITLSRPSTFPTHTVRVAGQDVPGFTAERQALHQRILDQEESRFRSQLAMSGQPSPHRRAHIVTGPMGAGKSCFVALPLMEQDRAMLLDADTLKRYFPQDYHVSPALPEVQGLALKPNNGLGAGAVHRESSYLFSKLLDRALAQGNNLVMSYTGRDLGWDQRLIGQLKQNGYQVFLHHVQVSLRTSIQRMFHRFNTEGRYTPPDVLIRTSANATDNFVKLKDWGMRTGLIDGYAWYFNDIQEGSPPVLIESLSRTRDTFQANQLHGSCVLNLSPLPETASQEA